MKAIIIAAGLGNRLMPLTDDKPKCLLEINGKTIMQRQLEMLQQCGINNIVVVRGYKRKDFKSYAEDAFNKISNEIVLRPLHFEEFCMEIDTMDDLEKARRWLENRTGEGTKE